MIKHVHCDLIVAWANGAEIEYSFDNQEWFNNVKPSWMEKGIYYRVKPKLEVFYYPIYRDDTEYIASCGYSDLTNLYSTEKSLLDFTGKAVKISYVEDKIVAVELIETDK